MNRKLILLSIVSPLLFLSGCTGYTELYKTYSTACATRGQDALYSGVDSGGAPIKLYKGGCGINQPDNDMRYVAQIAASALNVVGYGVVANSVANMVSNVATMTGTTISGDGNTISSSTTSSSTALTGDGTLTTTVGGDQSTTPTNTSTDTQTDTSTVNETTSGDTTTGDSNTN